MILLVWDTSTLFHAAKADRFEVMADCAKGTPEQPWHNTTTAAVVDELKLNSVYPDLAWLSVKHTDSLDELRATIDWADSLGVDAKSGRNLGEATVCAWAEINSATAIIDDLDARRVARKAGLTVHGSLWVVAKAVCQQRLTVHTAQNFVDALIRAGARYPCGDGGFGSWARRNNLI